MQGWAQPQSSTFAHYFQDYQSLCGKYFETGKLRRRSGVRFCPACMKKQRELDVVKEAN